jgi:hypothetical protein
MTGLYPIGIFPRFVVPTPYKEGDIINPKFHPLLVSQKYLGIEFVIKKSLTSETFYDENDPSYYYAYDKDRTDEYNKNQKTPHYVYTRYEYDLFETGIRNGGTKINNSGDANKSIHEVQTNLISFEERVKLNLQRGENYNKTPDYTENLNNWFDILPTKKFQVQVFSGKPTPSTDATSEIPSGSGAYFAATANASQGGTEGRYIPLQKDFNTGLRASVHSTLWNRYLIYGEAYIDPRRRNSGEFSVGVSTYAVEPIEKPGHPEQLGVASADRFTLNLRADSWMIDWSRSQILDKSALNWLVGQNNFGHYPILGMGVYYKDSSDGTNELGVRADLTQGIGDLASVGVGVRGSVNSNGGWQLVIGASFRHPILIDVGHGIQTLDPGKVSYTWNGADKPAVATGWASGTTGILAFDEDGNGKIEGPRELDFTQHAPNANTDLEGLRLGFDSNQDGLLSAADNQFGKFRLWLDANENGLTEAGELRTLPEAGLSEMVLQPLLNTENTSVGANSLSNVGSFRRTDGTSSLYADVGFATLDDPDKTLPSNPDRYSIGLTPRSDGPYQPHDLVITPLLPAFPTPPEWGLPEWGLPDPKDSLPGNRQKHGRQKGGTGPRRLSAPVQQPLALTLTVPPASAETMAQEREWSGEERSGEERSGPRRTVNRSPSPALSAEERWRKADEHIAAMRNFPSFEDCMRQGIGTGCGYLHPVY